MKAWTIPSINLLAHLFRLDGKVFLCHLSMILTQKMFEWAGEMARLGNSLPHKHKDLSLEP